MIYTIESGSEYCSSSILMVSDALQKCIDAVNTHENFPYMGDFIRVTSWDNNGKPISVSETNGNREYESWDCTTVEFKINPLTVEEINSRWKEIK